MAVVEGGTRAGDTGAGGQGDAFRSHINPTLCPHLPVAGYHLPDGQQSPFEEQTLQGVFPAQLHPVEGGHRHIITLETTEEVAILQAPTTSRWMKLRDPLL